MLEIHPKNEPAADESTVRKFSPWFTGFHRGVGLPYFALDAEARFGWFLVYRFS